MTTAHFDQLQLAEHFWPWHGINASPQTVSCATLFDFLLQRRPFVALLLSRFCPRECLAGSGNKQPRRHPSLIAILSNFVRRTLKFV